MGDGQWIAGGIVVGAIIISLTINPGIREASKARERVCNFLDTVHIGDNCFEAGKRNLKPKPNKEEGKCFPHQSVYIIKRP